MSTTFVPGILHNDASDKLNSYKKTYPRSDTQTTKKQYNSLTRLPSDVTTRMHFETSSSTQQIASSSTSSSNKEQQVLQSKLDSSPTSTSTPISTSLHDVDFKLLQTRLSLRAKNQQEKMKTHEIRIHDRPLYYQPRNSSSVKNFNDEIKNFVPPNVNLPCGKSSARAPKQYSSTYFANNHDMKEVIESIKNDLQEDELIEAQNIDNPTGEWENPIVKQAIKRQINMEYYIKMLLRNLLYFSLILSFESILEKIILMYHIKLKAQPIYVQMIKENQQISRMLNSPYLLLIERLILVPSIICILISTFTLLKGQDQCWDLPLNSTQRKLIGLKVVETAEPLSVDGKEDAELTLKRREYDADKIEPYKVIPKYRKLNDYSMFNIAPIPRLKEDKAEGQSLFSARKSMTNLAYKRPYAAVISNNDNNNNTTQELRELATPNPQRRYSSKKIEQAQSEFSKHYDLKF
ncbi:hypothetical protein KGF56_001322 [Candida oxycetoniae]|uniref:Uncharacterized protein n=1 Tax=Candida oxycetoniae TaxID=497107 RepID=A0AAI9T014_9ASCO|nr:uncharacterized protein KGF56_001322 [Candida oxycetoniae]KAI3405716.2 hypothetical protein KGF56_001322 [Candida oxycetoniae]